VVSQRLGELADGWSDTQSPVIQAMLQAGAAKKNCSSALYG